MIAFLVFPTYGTLTHLWNADPYISGHNYWYYSKNNVQAYLEPWGSNSWGFRAITWYQWFGGGHGKIDTAKIIYYSSSDRVYMYGYQGWTFPPWVGVVSMSQGSIPGDNPAEEGWYKPPPLKTKGKQMQVEIKYREGNYGDSKNWAWNFGAARIMINTWFKDRTNGYDLVLDLCVDEKIGWGGVSGMSGTFNYFVGVWSSEEKVPLGNRWFKVTVDLDYYLNRAINHFNRNPHHPGMYDRDNMWLYGAEFLLELYNAKRETWIEYFKLSYE